MKSYISRPKLIMALQYTPGSLNEIRIELSRRHIKFIMDNNDDCAPICININGSLQAICIGNYIVFDKDTISIYTTDEFAKLFYEVESEVPSFSIRTIEIGAALSCEKCHFKKYAALPSSSCQICKNLSNFEMEEGL